MTSTTKKAERLQLRVCLSELVQRVGDLCPSRMSSGEKKTVVTVPLKWLLFVLFVALLFAAPEPRILLPRVATVRLFYDKSVSMVKRGGGGRTSTLDFSFYISIQSF